jgi:hypothetical protein
MTTDISYRADYAVIALWGPRSVIQRWCGHFPETVGEANEETGTVSYGAKNAKHNAPAFTLVFEYSDKLESWLKQGHPGDSEAVWLMRTVTKVPLPKDLRIKTKSLSDVPARAWRMPGDALNVVPTAWISYEIVPAQ